MAMIYFVRHGKAAAGFGDHHDPGLDATGAEQAETTARLLAPLGPLAVYSSPLARARETADPLIARWGVESMIEPRVAEIPSPTEDLAERTAWLREFMQGRWSEQPAELRAWREQLIGCLLSLPEDTVLFSHFVAINVAVGAAQHDDRVVVFRPDNGSVTRLATADGQLRVVELGREASTRVL
jgi:broad specificity phosphatase PhoE